MKTDWLERALCREHNPEMWFPLPGEYLVGQAAKAICKLCPVTAQCAETALARGDADGIMAGLSLRQLSVTDRRAQLDAIAAGVKP